MVSTAPQVLHWFVSVGLIATKGSLVGVRSWITIYHLERWASEIHAVLGCSIGVSNWHRGICGHALRRPSVCYYVRL